MTHKVRKVKRDGIDIWKFTCTECGVEGEIDDDQYNGRVSILCDCGFHETINLSETSPEEKKELKEINDDAMKSSDSIRNMTKISWELRHQVYC